MQGPQSSICSSQEEGKAWTTVHPPLALRPRVPVSPVNDKQQAEVKAPGRQLGELRSTLATDRGSRNDLERVPRVLWHEFDCAVCVMCGALTVIVMANSSPTAFPNELFSPILHPPTGNH
ncbi:hypothetical protein AAFF_G00162010 [Aldrovandia affinis]|uniref:Uncharacterized protein n=1 Tax=Aldrovandia affinis TaxID=143900 RepID=A0AAD7RMR7_9TELE|nr:hypothetical protein AAFF_G00162010 [Aldrovandia affinis]